MLPVTLNNYTHKTKQCIYCKQKIGDLHENNCVVIVSNTKYQIVFKDIVIGFYTTRDPFSWTIKDRVFHKNESSWCTSNMVNSNRIQIIQTDIWDELIESSDDGCLCYSNVQLYPVEISKIVKEG